VHHETLDVWTQFTRSAAAAGNGGGPRLTPTIASVQPGEPQHPTLHHQHDPLRQGAIRDCSLSQLRHGDRRVDPRLVVAGKRSPQLKAAINSPEIELTKSIPLS
jgi:hypothetical protein